jgi:hypothetical protein
MRFPYTIDRIHFGSLGSLDLWPLAFDHAEVTGKTEIQDPEIGVNNAANCQK